MKTIIKSLSFPALALAIYLAVQLATFSIVGVITLIMNDSMSVEAMSIGLLVSSIITAVVLLAVRPFGLGRAFSSAGCSLPMCALSITAAILGMFATDVVCEQLDLKNIYEEMFLGMSSNVYGVAAVCLAGPVSEEILFRGAIMSPMLRKGVRPWQAITVSALIFGLIHLNPAQIPFAFIVGIILGVIYYKTGSLVVSSICHIINNSLSIYTMYTYGEGLKDMTWEKMLGGTVAVYAVAVVCAVLSVFMLAFFWRKQRRNWFETKTY
ncbi:MAG: CPBP family intramembrane metalloprotease [Bacteroides sp.]|nr:CPBP family intramembrane metalloprotease [Roseburia sp.]MCM1346092.1 CPBP family intramembrane metalloprotease [Bacteroides sp.]MCM1420414.1 CPBP family intramembrane metalloprotease [Bacteroides sp.]